MALRIFLAEKEAAGQISLRNTALDNQLFNAYCHRVYQHLASPTKAYTIFGEWKEQDPFSIATEKYEARAQALS